MELKDYENKLVDIKNIYCVTTPVTASALRNKEFAKHTKKKQEFPAKTFTLYFVSDTYIRKALHLTTGKIIEGEREVLLAGDGFFFEDIPDPVMIEQNFLGTEQAYDFNQIENCCDFCFDKFEVIQNQYKNLIAKNQVSLKQLIEFEKLCNQHLEDFYDAELNNFIKEKYGNYDTYFERYYC